jgi:hypothetical protein
MEPTPCVPGLAAVPNRDARGRHCRPSPSTRRLAPSLLPPPCPSPATHRPQSLDARGHRRLQSTEMAEITAVAPPLPFYPAAWPWLSPSPQWLALPLSYSHSLELGSSTRRKPLTRAQLYHLDLAMGGAAAAGARFDGGRGLGGGGWDLRGGVGAWAGRRPKLETAAGACFLACA